VADVFLSYARASANSAQRIAAGLRDCGFSVWFDENLPAHRAYSDVIEEQLEAASAVLVLWSREATQSQWVRSEANRARESGRLVQVRLDDARLPMPFDQIQCADLCGWSGGTNASAWRRVVESVAALAKRELAERSGPARVRGTVVNRRLALLGGGAVAVAAVAGFGLWRSSGEPQISPEAQLLIQKGFDALQSNDALDTQEAGSTMQAIALLTEATKAAPESSAAWGGLAMAYAVRKRAMPLSQRPGLDSRSRSAARTALELDPREPRALGALRLLDPVYRHWLAAERADREALRKNPTLPILLFIMSDMLGSVGRWSDAVQFSKKFDRRKFLIPGADRKVVFDLWASGGLQAADSALELAVQHWPQHPQIWRTRIAYLMYSGRPTEALDLLRGGPERPPEISAEYISAARATAEALAGQRSASEAIRQDLEYVQANPSSALQIAQACVALADPQTAFALLDGYYFGEGKWSQLAPPAGDEDRVTNPLFQPPMRELWHDARFGRLLERTGLNAYWRQSRTIPDFRRG
jgi:tetratricopeptide (TPR) repeat protein